MKYIKYFITPSKRPALSRLLRTKTRERLGKLHQVQDEMDVELQGAKDVLLDQTSPRDIALWGGVVFEQAAQQSLQDTVSWWKRRWPRIIAAVVVISVALALFGVEVRDIMFWLPGGQ